VNVSDPAEVVLHTAETSLIGTTGQVTVFEVDGPSGSQTWQQGMLFVQRCRLQVDVRDPSGKASCWENTRLVLSALLAEGGVPGSSRVAQVSGPAWSPDQDGTPKYSSVIEADFRTVIPSVEQQYLTKAEAEALFERLGVMAEHLINPDPHPQYLTQAEGDDRYGPGGGGGTAGNATEWYWGAGPPPSDTTPGDSNDYYLDILTGDVYSRVPGTVVPLLPAPPVDPPVVPVTPLIPGGS
jgi:hypothetical protein